MSRQSRFAVLGVFFVVAAIVAVKLALRTPEVLSASPSSNTSSSMRKATSSTPLVAEEIAKPLIAIVSKLEKQRAAASKAQVAEKEASDRYGVIYHRLEAHRSAVTDARIELEREIKQASQSAEPVAKAFAPVYAVRQRLNTLEAEQQLLNKEVDVGGDAWERARSATSEAVGAKFQLESELETLARMLLLEDFKEDRTETYSAAMLIVVKELARTSPNQVTAADALKGYEASNESFLVRAKEARKAVAEDAKFDEVWRREWKLRDKMQELLQKPLSKDVEAELEAARKEERELAVLRVEADAVSSVRSSAHRAAKEAQDERADSFRKVISAVR